MKISDSHFHAEMLKERGVDIALALSKMEVGIDVSSTPPSLKKRIAIIEETLGKESIALYSIKNASFSQDKPIVCFSTSAGPWCVGQKDTKDLIKAVEKEVEAGAIAIGECGLDYTLESLDIEEQKKLFQYQIDIAKNAKLPLLIHTNCAFEDTIDMIAKSKLTTPILIHCFSGDSIWVKKFVDLSCYIAYGGMSTYKKNKDILESSKYVPDNRILLETDSPYLPPTGHRGEVNTPLNLDAIATFVSSARGELPETLVKKTNANLLNFLGL